MPIDLISSLLVFFGVVFGLAWPLAARLPLAAAEKIAASFMLSLLGVFLFAWCVYVWAIPAAVLWVLPALGAFGLAIGLRDLDAAWRDTDGRALLIGQLIVTGWCLGWLATIASYAGGGWTSDWFEHWERARFFLERLPLDQKFLGTYTLTARPPLANVVTAALLFVTRADFAHFQFVSTLLASLVYLPAALLARRFGRDVRTISLCAALFLVNPLLVQNATFAWTKLPAAAFVLTALYFFLRAQERGSAASVAVLCAASLAAGFLAHYSAGPYAVLLALGWIGLGWPRRHEREWQRATSLAAGTGAVVLATWFSWALATYGAHETFFSNSSVTAAESNHGSLLAKIALNLRDTLVPHFLRSLDASLITQLSSWGHWSDWVFQCYQLNLPLACGCLAWLAIARELWRVYRTAAVHDRIFWGMFIAGVVLLGVGTHGARDVWGLTHICLQALVLLAVAFLAARWGVLERAWRLALIAGATVDLSLGILLHGGVQSYAFDRWFAAGGVSNQTLHSYTESAFMNLAAKIKHHLAFFSDTFAAPLAAVLGALALLLGLALWRARQPRASRNGVA